MNVELVDPALVLRVFSPTDAAQRNLARKRAPAWARAFLTRLDEEIRYRRALHELRRLDDRELDDLGIASADLGVLAWRHADGHEAVTRI